MRTGYSWLTLLTVLFNTPAMAFYLRCFLVLRPKAVHFVHRPAKKVYVIVHYNVFCSSIVVLLLNSLNFQAMQKLKKILAKIVTIGGWVVAAAEYLIHLLG